jgi:alpha-tubulin suppressor-like RCC1 family protein
MGGRARRGVHAVTIVAAAAVAIAGTAAPAAAAPAARQTITAHLPGVFGYGWNASGEVGDGTTTHRATPVPVALPAIPSAGVQQLALGLNTPNAAALMPDGTVDTWGLGGFGSLGDGTTADRSTPAPVPGLTSITQIADGSTYMLAVGSGGTVWSWGNNQYGQLGDGTTTNHYRPAQIPGLTGITHVAADSDHVIALRSNGTVVSWGSNAKGQLGDGTTTDRHSPTPVPGLSGIKQVAAGEYMGYALRSDGTLFAWGSGYLGTGTTSSPTPVAVPLAGVTQVATSGADTLAIAGPNATVYAWGVNFGGEIGDGTQYVPRTTPVQLNLNGITQVAEGLFSSEAVRSDGSLFGWGPNGLLELGIGGNPGNHLVPVQNIYLSNVSEIALGYESGLAFGQYDAATVPSVIGYTQSEAATALQAAGFALGRVSQIVDITCEYIGEVKTQTPAAGTLARLGTAVSIGIGKPGGKCL